MTRRTYFRGVALLIAGEALIVGYTANESLRSLGECDWRSLAVYLSVAAFSAFLAVRWSWELGEKAS